MIHLITRLPLPYHQTLCRTLDAGFNGAFCAWFGERSNKEFPFQASAEFEFCHHFLSEVGYLKLWRALKEDRNAVVVLGGWSSPMTNKTLMATAWLRVPLFIWADHPHPRKRNRASAVLRQSYLRRLSRSLVSGFLVCGKSTADYMSSLGVAPDKLIEFPYWIDLPKDWSLPDRCLKTGPEEQPLRLVAIGRLVPVKQFAVAIRAIARVNEKAGREIAQLRIVGDGPERNDLAELARSLRVDRAVSFAGWLEAEQVQQALRDSDALVITSAFDAFGVVVLEAMAQARPVLASKRVIAARDRDEEAGAVFLHEVSDVETLAKQISLLSCDSALLAKASAAARATAEKWPAQRAVAILRSAFETIRQRRRASKDAVLGAATTADPSIKTTSGVA